MNPFSLRIKVPLGQQIYGVMQDSFGVVGFRGLALNGGFHENGVGYMSPVFVRVRVKITMNKKIAFDHPQLFKPDIDRTHPNILVHKNFGCLVNPISLVKPLVLKALDRFRYAFWRVFLHVTRTMNFTGRELLECELHPIDHFKYGV